MDSSIINIKNVINSHAGVQSGAATRGLMPEIWVNNGQDVTLDNVGHGPGSNLLPVKGHVNGTRRDDLVVEVVAALLLRSIDVPTQVIVGQAVDPNQHKDIGGHAWNEAWDGSKRITFDACWDQVYFQENAIAPPAAVLDDYFTPSSTVFNQTHVPDPSQPFAWSFRLHHVSRLT